MAARRYFQISLRTVFVLLSIGCIWLGWQAKKARKQRELAATVEAAGGTVMYDFHEVRPCEFDSREPPPGPAWLSRLLGRDFLGNVVWVELEERPSAKMVEMLARLGGPLKLLAIRDPTISDSEFRRLRRLSHLKIRVLDVHGPRVSDASIEELKEAMPKTNIWVDQGEKRMIPL